MSISSYFWYAYDQTTSYVSAASNAAIEKAKNIKREDLAAAANKVKDAALSVIQSASCTCDAAWNLIGQQPPVIAQGEEDGDQQQEGWVDLDPGAPGGPNPGPLDLLRKKNV